MIEQTILGLVRPNLNLSQNIDQISHLIEHILLSPERQSAIGLTDQMFAEDILNSNGWVSELFCVEYYTVRRERAEKIKKILLDNQSTLHLKNLDLEAAKKTLLVELEENHTPEISNREFWCQNIYTQDSPVLAQPWYDISKVMPVSREELEKIYQDYYNPLWFLELNYDDYQVPEQLISKKNQITNEVRTVKLTHPRQSDTVTDVDILIPLKIRNDNVADLIFYRKALTDYHFGVLTNSLRHEKGLIYHIGISYNQYGDYLRLYYSCPKEAVKESLQTVLSSIENFEQSINGNFNLLKAKIATTYDLIGQNIVEEALGFIEDVVIGGITKTPKEIEGLVLEKNNRQIQYFNQEIKQLIEEKSIIALFDYDNETKAVKSEKFMDI